MVPSLRPRIAALAGLALACSSCHATFSDPRVPAGKQESKWVGFYLVGAVGHAEVDVRDFCDTGRAREVDLGGDVLTVGVSVLTLGIYTPRKVTVICAAPEARK